MNNQRIIQEIKRIKEKNERIIERLDTEIDDKNKDATLSYEVMPLIREVAINKLKIANILLEKFNGKDFSKIDISNSEDENLFRALDSFEIRTWIQESIWTSKTTGHQYKFVYCGLCDHNIICCPECDNGSCSGGGCEYCNNDQKLFHSEKHQIEYYLDKNEMITKEKISYLSDWIKESINNGSSEINFELLSKYKMNKHAKELFGYNNG